MSGICGPVADGLSKLPISEVIGKWFLDNPAKEGRAGKRSPHAPLVSYTHLHDYCATEASISFVCRAVQARLAMLQ